MKKITIVSSVLPILMFVVIADAQTMRGDEGVSLREQQEIMLQNIEETREGFQNILRDRDAEARDVESRDESNSVRGVETSSENRQAAEDMRMRVLEINEQRQAELAEKLTQRRQDLLLRRQEVLQQRDQRLIQLSEQRRERVANGLSNVLNGYLNHTNALDNISFRLETRINALEERGVNVGEANSLLETANSLLNDTLAEIEVVRIELSEIIENETSVEYVRELISGIRESLQATREAYRAVLQEINN